MLRVSARIVNRPVRHAAALQRFALLVIQPKEGILFSARFATMCVLLAMLPISHRNSVLDACQDVTCAVSKTQRTASNVVIN